MAKKLPVKPKKIAKENLAASPELSRQKRLISDLRKKEHFMRWAIAIALVIILLLFLFLGYATDWTRGLRSSGTVPISSGLDAQSTEDAATTPATTDTSSDTNGSDTTGNNANTTTNGSTNTSSTDRGTNTSSNNSSKETSSQSSNTSATNTQSTTTNNNTSTNTQPPSGLVSLYADSTAGSDISKILDSAQLLGVNATCHDELLIQVCLFGSGDQLITTKNLRGTGIVTSILKNF